MFYFIFALNLFRPIINNMRKNFNISYFKLFILKMPRLNRSNKKRLTSLDEAIIKSNTILGSKFVAKNRTGAAYYLSIEELAKFNYTDINRALNKILELMFTKKMALVYDLI